MKSSIRAIASVILLFALLSGCATGEYNARVTALNEHLSPEWLKANIEIGKTTPTQILSLFGKPVLKTSSSSAGASGLWMPDEIWTYSVRFFKSESKGWDVTNERWTRGVAFSFKNGVVSDFQTSEVAF